MCGFRLIGEEAIRVMLTNQQALWQLEQAGIAQAEEKERKAREVRLNPLFERLEPTPAQRRRGATHATECAHCGKHLFRRKREVAAGNSFCSSVHQREWIKIKEAA
jgi:hypothetical protein